MPEIESTSKPEQELPKKKEEEPVRTSASDKKPQPEYKINNPILASQVEKRQMKIAKLEDKNTVLSQKIAKNETKIEKQQAKIEDAQKTKAYCKTLLESAALPQPLQIFFKSMMDRQESRIEKCSNKIDKLQDKNKNFTDKISSNNKKIAKHTTKIESLQKIDKFLTNMQSREGRRENFIQAISDFRKSSLDRNSKKSLMLEMKITQKEMALSKATSSAEKVQLRNQIAKLHDKLDFVNERIIKLTAMSDRLENLTILPDEQSDKVIQNTTKSINNQLTESQNINEQIVEDTVINEAGKAIDTFYDYQINGKINQYMKTEVINSNGFDEMKYLHIEQNQADYLKSIKDKQGLEFAIFNAKPDTNNQVKITGYTLVYRASNSDEIMAALSDFENNTKHNTLSSNDKINDTDKQGENALDVTALCAAIPIAFAENHDMQTRLVHTTAVFTALAENFNFDDVKSAVAIGIMDRKEDTAISDQAKAWASKLPLTDTLKSFADTKGSLPLEIKSGYLDVFAKKVGAWEQSRQTQTKENAVLNRESITKSAAQIHQKKSSPEHTAETQRNNQSI